ncbi:hypothetical protein BJV82DRAFT_590359 [Fennellomyces sp. T-0311]|nr:hypothetical protein BJV82DRAFT_590359 [Fennellomyces sp. T-0311]
MWASAHWQTAHTLLIALAAFPSCERRFVPQAGILLVLGDFGTVTHRLVSKGALTGPCYTNVWLVGGTDQKRQWRDGKVIRDGLPAAHAQNKKESSTPLRCSKELGFPCSSMNKGASPKKE